MANPHENYEQDKIKGDVKQTVILDEAETGETDELDPKYHQDESPDVAPADPGRDIHDNLPKSKSTEVDDNASKDDHASSEAQAAPTDVDAGLNHNEDDDLSLNKPENDLF